MKLNIKRLLSIMLCCGIMIFTGCNNGDTSSDTSSGSTTEETDDGTGEDTTPQPIKVGFIYNGIISENDYASNFEEIRQDIIEKTEIETCYIEGVNVADFEEAVKILSENNCTMIVSTSHKYTNAMTQTAKKYTNINFINYGTKGVGGNMSSFEGKIYQAAYLAGTAAAFNSENEKIGIVADPTLTLSRAVINAFTLGSQFVYQNGSVNVAYAITKDEIYGAVDQLVEEGCDIIMGYTVTDDVVKYCEKLGITVIGNHTQKEGESEYKHLLMTFDYNWGDYLLKQMKLYKREEWVPTSMSGGVFEKVVSYSPVASWAKTGTAEIIDTLKSYVNNGKAQIFKGEIQDNKGNIQVMRDKVLTDDQITSMEWLVKGTSVSGNFIVPNTLVAPSDFVVHQ